MKIAFISNYYNHHQAPLSRCLSRLTGGEYRFIATEPMEEERFKMGWGGDNDDFVLELSQDECLCREFIDNADAVIIGSAPEKLIKRRLKEGKLTFKYSERLYKNGVKTYTLPIRAVQNYFRWGKYKNFYLLCASAYAAGDYSKTGNFINKAYKWGYYPSVKRYENVDEFFAEKSKSKVVSVLWAGRLIDWKHPDSAVRTAKKLRDNGYEFEMNIIGNGALEDSLRALISEYDLEDRVNMLGSMKPEEVRGYMERADIYLFTSDQCEGWGAVLNESMNSGCAVVADRAIGSVPYLLKHGVNGMIYSGEDELYKYTEHLIKDASERERMGREAYRTMTDMWNAENAAKRFLMLCKELKNKDKADIFTNGPLSRE